jgi:hypothetical protein
MPARLRSRPKTIRLSPLSIMEVVSMRVMHKLAEELNKA